MKYLLFLFCSICIACNEDGYFSIGEYRHCYVSMGDEACCKISGTSVLCGLKVPWAQTKKSQKKKNRIKLK